MNTMDWSVRLVVACDPAPTHDQIGHLHDMLHTLHAAVGETADGRLEFHTSVAAATLLEAVGEAARTVTDALAGGHLTGTFEELEALTLAEFDRRLDGPQLPELWGVNEATDFLNVSTQRVNQLLETYPERLPEALKLAGPTGARLWFPDTWRRFAADRPRPGRPRKQAASVDGAEQ